MRQFTSVAAKSLITIIGTEYAMAQKRVERGFIKEDQMLGTLLERLNRLSCDNVNLRKFLDNVGHIPIEEDENMDLEWAKDPRENGENDNDTGEAYPFQIPSTARGHEDEPYDDGKKKPRYGFNRDGGGNALTDRSKRDSKT